MGYQKKRKTQHLSDAEIWDDSALIQSWDEAVAEYEYYHSIHARGEDVEEVLRQAEMEEEKANSNTPATINDRHPNESASPRIDGEYEDGEVADDHVQVEGSTAAAEGDDAAAYENEAAAAGPSLTNANARTDDGGPTTSLKGSNQVLENIKMAYWWAGYYSGLYEGQQQARDNTTTQAQQ